MATLPEGTASVGPIQVHIASALPSELFHLFELFQDEHGCIRNSDRLTCYIGRLGLPASSLVSRNNIVGIEIDEDAVVAGVPSSPIVQPR